jgi:intracellular sulfur oxidation DsrE/DsrF family protein
MKHIIPYILLFLSFGAMAQQKEENTNADFVILVSNFEQLEPIMMAAQDENRDGEIQVVFYGNEVNKITQPEIAKPLDFGQKYKVRFFVCQMSLDRLKIDHESVPKDIEIVDNAFLYSLLLQKKGYKSLTL